MSGLLLKDRDAVVAEAEGLVAKADSIMGLVESEHRTLTEEEREQVTASLDSFAKLAPKLEEYKKTVKLMGAVERIHGQVAGLDTSGAVKSVGSDVHWSNKVLEGEQMKAWLSSPSGNSPKVLLGGFKDLVTSTSVGDSVPAREAGLLRKQYANIGLRGLINVVRTNSEVIEFVRQTTRDGGAAFVPEATTFDDVGDSVTSVQAGVKPFMSLAYEVAKVNTSTVAVLAAVTRKALNNMPQLKHEIETELVMSIDHTLEKAILSGDGNNESFTGLLNTSGVQTVAGGSDPVGALRKGLTKLQSVKTVGSQIRPSAVVMHPEGVEALDLMKDTTGQYIGNGPWSVGPRTIWGLRVVESEEIPVNTVLMGDFSKATLYDAGNITIDFFDQHKDWAERNLLAIRAEGDAGFAVKVPAAFAKITVDAWS